MAWYSHHRYHWIIIRLSIVKRHWLRGSFSSHRLGSSCMPWSEPCRIWYCWFRCRRRYPINLYPQNRRPCPSTSWQFYSGGWIAGSSVLSAISQICIPHLSDDWQVGKHASPAKVMGETPVWAGEWLGFYPLRGSSQVLDWYGWELHLGTVRESCERQGLWCSTRDYQAGFVASLSKLIVS